MNATLIVMKEGEKLQRLLDASGHTQSDLAKKMNVTRGAIHHYTRKQTFDRLVWTRLRAGLVKLGLNPLDIRPTDIQTNPNEDLTVLVEEWERPQLEALKRILSAPTETRERVLAYVNGALRQSKDY